MIRYRALRFLAATYWCRRSVFASLSETKLKFLPRDVSWPQCFQSRFFSTNTAEENVDPLEKSRSTHAARNISLDSKMRLLNVLNKVYHDRSEEGMTKYIDPKIDFKEEHARNLDFEEFLLADKNGDGRVSSAEWEEFLEKKASIASEMHFAQPNAVNIEIPLSISDLNNLATESEGFHLSINGMRYKLQLMPEGKTADIIIEKTKQLREALRKFSKMDDDKRPLDLSAARYTKRVLTFGSLYLISQAAVIAKLTFFSRFGWDVMEPITYFITFGTAVMGLIFFQYHKIEYSYPALAAMMTHRKARKLYQKHHFDIDAYTDLQLNCLRLERQLMTLKPPRSLFSNEEARTLKDDLAQVEQIRKMRNENPKSDARRSMQREPSFSASDAY